MRLLQPDPKIHQLDKDWKYVPSNKTDIRKTFRRVRDRLAEEAKFKPAKVRELKRK
jgi:hypothetical protein